MFSHLVSQMSTDREIKYYILYTSAISIIHLRWIVNQGHSFSKPLIVGNGHDNDLYLKIWGSVEKLNYFFALLSL